MLNHAGYPGTTECALKHPGSLCPGQAQLHLCQPCASWADVPASALGRGMGWVTFGAPFPPCTPSVPECCTHLPEHRESTGGRAGVDVDASCSSSLTGCFPHPRRCCLPRGDGCVINKTSLPSPAPAAASVKEEQGQVSEEEIKLPTQPAGCVLSVLLLPLVLSDGFPCSAALTPPCICSWIDKSRLHGVCSLHEILVVQGTNPCLSLHATAGGAIFKAQLRGCRNLRCRNWLLAHQHK